MVLSCHGLQVRWTESWRRERGGVKLLNSNVPPDTVRATGLKALVLDWAGTTVDFGSLAPARTLQQVFARAGVKLSDADARRDMGLPKKDHISRIFAIPSVREAWQSLRGRAPSPSDLEEMYEAFIPLQFSCLADYSTLIPGVVSAVQRFHARGLKIGSTTGYTREMLDLLVEKSEQAGYKPDCSLVPGDVGGGRPHPFMIYEIAVRLQVYPLAAIAKVGDTPADVQEGLNAGAWSIGVAATGNAIGLSWTEFHALPESERKIRVSNAHRELEGAGAHYVVDSVADLDAVLDDIDIRLRSGSSAEASQAKA
jgi:phosphonoacetaldehyde hydrolase